MKLKFIGWMFILCFCVWAVVVDNAVMPSLKELNQDVGVYSRYRLKAWSRSGKLDFLKDELMVYAVVDNREQLYYIEYTPNFELTLKHMPAGTPVQMRYARRFPKFWKRHLYDMRENGVTRMSYSSYQLELKQREIWKFTYVMGGIFLFLAFLGLIRRTGSRR